MPISIPCHLTGETCYINTILDVISRLKWQKVGAFVSHLTEDLSRMSEKRSLQWPLILIVCMVTPLMMLKAGATTLRDFVISLNLYA